MIDHVDTQCAHAHTHRRVGAERQGGKRIERCSTARWLQPSEEAAENQRLESLLFVTVSLVDPFRSPVNLDGTVGFPNGFREIPPARDRAQLSSVPKAVTPQTL